MSCDGIGWIYDAFGDCIVSSTDKWSFAIGMISNFIWVVASFPEIYTICKTKDVEGISPFLFSCLTLGDTLSLIGNILTGGLATQIITCILYIICDGTMLAQYIYYHLIKGKCCTKPEEDEDAEENISTVATAVPVVAAAVAAAMDYSVPYKGTMLIGTITGWIGSCVYISSRVPQVWLNFKRKFVSNLSPYYFACTISGNVTYFLSLLIRDRTPEFMWKQAPWLVGSLGPLTCDIITAFQMCIYGFSTTPLGGEDIEEEEEKFEVVKEL